MNLSPGTLLRPCIIPLNHGNLMLGIPILQRKTKMELKVPFYNGIIIIIIQCPIDKESQDCAA